MSTIKSSAENLTLNADGANNDVIIQSNGSTKVTVDGATGNVGIGDTSPYESLRVAGTIKIAPANQTGTLAFGGTANADVHIGVFRGAANSLSAGNSLNLAGYDNITFSASSAVVGSQTERMRVTANGLTFNGDTAAANALDDYEEGTFIPKMGDNSTTMSNVVRASYVKVGKLVTLDIDVQTPTYSGANPHYIMNLPFTTSVASNGGGAVGYVDESDVVPAFHITGASTTLYFLNLRTGGTYNLSNKRVIFSVTYHIP